MMLRTDVSRTPEKPVYRKTKVKEDVRTAFQNLNAHSSRGIFFLYTLTNSVIMISSLHVLQEQNETRM